MNSVYTHPMRDCRRTAWAIRSGLYTLLLCTPIWDQRHPRLCRSGGTSTICHRTKWCLLCRCAPIASMNRATHLPHIRATMVPQSARGVSSRRPRWRNSSYQSFRHEKRCTRQRGCQSPSGYFRHHFHDGFTESISFTMIQRRRISS